MPDAPQNAHELVKCLDMRFKSILLARPFPLDELVGLAEGSVFASSMRTRIGVVYDELVGLKQSLFLETLACIPQAGSMRSHSFMPLDEILSSTLLF